MSSLYYFKAEFLLPRGSDLEGHPLLCAIESQLQLTLSFTQRQYESREVQKDLVLQILKVLHKQTVFVPLNKLLDLVIDIHATLIFILK
jgi:hypothetical protein